MPSDSVPLFQPVSAYQMYNRNKLGKQKAKKLNRKRETQQLLKKHKRPKLTEQQYHVEESVGSEDVRVSSGPVLKKNKKITGGSTITENPVSDALQLFEWLIDPMSADTFFSSYWEQKALHIKRANENYYTHLFSSSSLDKILRNNRLCYTQNIDVVCYEDGVKQVFNQDGRAVPSAVWDYYSNGCSIRVLNPHSYCPRVHLLLATLQEYFGSMVGANVYLTPPGSQGFAPHYDDIEAFVIQLEGRKHWKLYQPKDSDVLARYSSPNLKHEDIGDPFMELTLNAGEMLYFPRGTIHEGCTDPDAHSLHITVSVYQQTSYADLLHHILPDALKKAAENDLEFRKGLPFNYLKKFGAGITSKDNDSFFKKKVSNLITSLIKYVDMDSGVDQLGRKLMYDSMPPIPSKNEAACSSKKDGPYLKNGSIVNRVEINLETKVRLLRYYCIRLVNDSASPKLYYNTENATVYHGEEEQWLELDTCMIPSIQLLQATYPRYIEVKDLPVKDANTKMQFVSDLWEHGILVTNQPLERLED